MRANEVLPLRTLIAYGGPTLGVSYLLFFVQFYFLKYATDVLLLPPVAIGVLFALAKAWDAASNPLIGSWSDRSRSRLGRRRPFLLGSLPVLAAGFIMLWSPPAGLAPRALITWAAVGLFVFHTAFALYTIPHMALGAELSDDSHQRTRLFGARQIGFTLGMLLAFAGIQLAMNADAPREATARLAIPAALAAITLLAVTPLTVRERARARRGGPSLISSMRDVLVNRPARILLVVWFIESFGVGATGTMAPYVSQYVLRRPDVVGTIPAAYVVAGVLSIPLWVRISRRFGSRDTWLTAMVLASAAFGGMLFVGEGDVALIVGLLVVAGGAMGCGNVLSASIMADIIDGDALETGERREGIYSASMMFAMKIGISLATAVSGVALGAVGFVPNIEQSAESLFAIRMLFAGLPCIGFLTGALLFLRFQPGADAAAATIAAGLVGPQPSSTPAAPTSRGAARGRRHR
jgi:GPH family glycoside/pentoside/hexuronide:cation symporter